MKALLEQDELPVFLDMKAREMLLQARSTARDVGIVRDPFLQDGPDAIWFTWTGSKIQRTLLGSGDFRRAEGGRRRGRLVFEKATVVDKVQEVYRGFLTNCPDAVSLAIRFPTEWSRNTMAISRMI